MRRDRLGGEIEYGERESGERESDLSGMRESVERT